ncbi:hypothetical protein [Streptococcus equinus]|uniref:hypothetical protein n=1 Tax=Streptococcus equinus TaxID=1335 RepID=UPI000942F79E|nr:hypothetical protein [Streptococcus equinus]
MFTIRNYKNYIKIRNNNPVGNYATEFSIDKTQPYNTLIVESINKCKLFDQKHNFNDGISFKYKGVIFTFESYNHLAKLLVEIAQGNVK